MQAETKPAPKKKKKRIYKRHFGPLGSAGVSKLTQSLQESEYVLFEQEYKYEEETPYTPSPTMMNMPNSCHSIVKVSAIHLSANDHFTAKKYLPLFTYTCDLFIDRLYSDVMIMYSKNALMLDPSHTVLGCNSSINSKT